MEPDPTFARVASFRRSPGARALTWATRLAALVPLMVGVVWAGGCHEDRIGGPELPDTTTTLLPQVLAMVSDPIRVGSRASSGAAASGRGASQEDEVFVSLPPGAIPNGAAASVRNPRTGSAVSVAMTDGGFDPVVVAARAGDSLEIEARMSGGGSPLGFTLSVPLMRRPVVVRTEPPPRKRDVPLNARLVIVFSEPVSGTTLTSASVQLLRGTTPVAGTVSLLDGSAIAGVFTPSAPLEANTDYQLIVTRAVQDLGGDALEEGVAVAFTTGQSLTGPAASLQLSPDSVTLVLSWTYTLRATVRDGAGNALIGQPVSWTSSDPAVATLAPVDSNGQTLGRVTAVSAGTATITATSGTVTGTAIVTVSQPVPPVPSGIASVTLSRESLSVAAQDTLVLIVTPRDSNGIEIRRGFTISLTSSNPAVVTVPATTDPTCGQPSGCYWWHPWNYVTIKGLAEGTTVVTATIEGVSGRAVITVGPSRRVASVTLMQDQDECCIGILPPRRPPTRLLLQSTDTLRATLRDSNGTEITERDGGVRQVAWTVDNPAAATVDTVGRALRRVRNYGRESAVLTTIGSGSVTVTATSEGMSGTATITVPPLLTFASVSTGSNVRGFIGDYSDGHTCGVTTGGAAYCWGSNANGELGDGLFDDGYDVQSRIPVPGAVSGGLTFSSVSAGTWYSCGLTTAGAAYCWGWGGYGQLGDGSTGYSSVPVVVSGALSFVAISAGYYHACGLIAAGAAYCWGNNGYGQLGDGSPQDQRVPTAVSGGLSFVAVSAGFRHTCGLTAAGAAYCWGNNSYGELGDGSTTGRGVPAPVSGGQSFVALVAGHMVSCGLTAAGAAYCWGYNGEGSLGDGSITDQLAPAAVSGGLSFVSLTAGRAAANVCGLTADGAAYCWGNNSYGQLGDGTTSNRSVPTAVLGGLRFASVSASGNHTCAVSTTAIAYCWGSNNSGALGSDVNGGTVPVKVASQP